MDRINQQQVEDGEVNSQEKPTRTFQLKEKFINYGKHYVRTIIIYKTLNIHTQW